MSFSDPIADMLTRMRNAIRARHDSVQVPASRLKREICEVLKREGFIVDYQEKTEGIKSTLVIHLKYTETQECVIKNLRRVSRPSLRIYSQSKGMRPVRSGLGISIVSTSKGVMTGKQARSNNVGGEVLCEVW